MHASGWLHGQVWPEHVMISPQGHTTLIDLTQARRLTSSECDTAEIFPAAAHYAAPETTSPRDRLTPAADTYSLGVMLFEALAGQPPFSAAAPRQLMACHRRAAPPDLRQLRAGISLEVAALVRRVLAKEPLRRPSDDELVRWLAELEIEELSS
jgi:serine/threonine-protein kinase